jgi:hypothetical protein
MSTKKKISDNVLFRLAGGIPDGSFPVDERDIWNSLEDKINAMFKVRHFDTLKSGETMPEHAMIATYESITVTTVDGGRSKATIPVTPISLPKNMGIYNIYSADFPDVFFVPLQRGQRSLLRADDLLNELFGQFSYEPKNKEVYFNKDLTLYDIDTVTMELCVFDMSQYGVTDTLPIPADYLDALENELVAEFSTVLPESGGVNNFSTAGQNIPINTKQ